VLPGTHIVWAMAPDTAPCPLPRHRYNLVVCAYAVGDRERMRRAFTRLVEQQAAAAGSDDQDGGEEGSGVDGGAGGDDDGLEGGGGDDELREEQRRQQSSRGR
jgi:hypothetical protein